ncbi:hypothetical protein GF371_02090 [Candidatus Woesearchaeota archaeon]|nr:hypothetical protein [Candidatus Woesearchaeota archaeon]
MPISSDVNVIFAYVDETDIFHMPVVIFITPYKRKDVYFLLDEVKSSFIYTYSQYLKDACVFIEKSIIDYKSKRSKLLPKPSPFAINAIIRENIKKKLEGMSKKEHFRYDTVNRFTKKMLTEYSTTSLYEDSEKLSEFREKYLTKAEKEADIQISLFLNKFRNFEVVNFADVQSFEEWLGKLKKVELNVFKNKRDYEDMKIAAQYLGYNQEIRTLSFVTCDKEFHDSLDKVSKHFKQPIGKLFLLKPPKKQKSP